MDRIAATLFTSLILASCAPTSSVELRKVTAAPTTAGSLDLSFELFLEKSNYRGEETVFAYCYLQNRSDKVLTVNKRLSSSFLSGSQTSFDIVMQISPDPRTVITSAHPEDLTASHFEVLLPGERVYSQAIVISDIKGLPPGAYRLSATYKNWYVPKGGAAALFSIWTGECRSNEVKFTKEP